MGEDAAAWSSESAQKEWAPALDRLAKLVKDNPDTALKIWLRNLAWRARSILLARQFYIYAIIDEKVGMSSGLPGRELWDSAQRTDIPVWFAEYSIYHELRDRGKIESDHDWPPRLFDPKIISFIEEYPLPEDDANELASTIAFIQDQFKPSRTSRH